MTTIPQASKFVLPNGLRIVTENIPTLRSIALGIHVGVGSGNENGDEAGISHYIEHMLFKGTKKRSAFEIAHALDAVGGRMNAYTNKESTMYYATVLDRHADISIDVLCDMLLNSLFDPKEMETEKSVILEEIKMYEDTPDELIHDFFAEKILHGHPLGNPTIGHVASVKATKRENIINYMSRFYSPQNVIVSVAGALPPNLLDLLKPYFEKFEGKEVTHKQPQPEIKGVLALKNKKTEQTHMCLGVKGPSQLDDDRYTHAILDNIMGGSMSSRLFQEVREKRGLVYSIFATNSPFRDFGISYVYAGTSKENLKQVIEIILEQMRLIKKEGLTTAEIERGKENLKGSTVLGLESSSARMGYLAKSEYFYDRIVTIDEMFANIDKVDNNTIIALANKYFRDEYLTLAVIGDLDELPVKTLTL